MLTILDLLIFCRGLLNDSTIEFSESTRLEFNEKLLAVENLTKLEIRK